MYLFVNNNRGLILITSFIVATVLLILGAAFFTWTITQHTATQRANDISKTFYATEMGVEYAFIESQNAGWAWHTHDVEGGTDKLIKKGTPPDVLLPAGNINSASGCYEIITPYQSGYGLVEVKTYADPDKTNETIVLSRCTIGSSSRIIKFRISSKSLYRYLLFWPESWYSGGNPYYGKQIDGENVGALHVNGDLDVYTSDFYDFAELSCSGDIYYHKSSQFDEPIAWDDNYYDGSGVLQSSGGSVDGIAPLSKHSSPPYDFVYPLGYDYKFGIGGHGRSSFQHPDIHIYGWDTTNEWPGEGGPKAAGWMYVNDKPIPKVLPDSYSASSWQWDKYYNSPRDNNEKPVKFKVSNEALEWLIEKEIAHGEYNIVPDAWLQSADADGNWSNSEHDTVTVLSIDKETGYGASYGVEHGLDEHSEYEMYGATKQYQQDGTFPAWVESESAEVKTRIKTWIQNDIQNVNGLITWWKNRHYHHRENLTQSGSVYRFLSDNTTRADNSYVPAYERVFWEAWINYWPEASGRNKAHNQIHTPAAYGKAINEEWWDNLEYGNDRMSEEKYLAMESLNTNYQGAEFYQWLCDTEYTTDADPSDKYLNEVVKYKDYGGNYETPLAIEANYAPPAQAGGLYIKEDAGTFTISLNGSSSSGSTLSECLTALGITWINTNKFYNPYETNKSSWDMSDIANNAIQVIEIDVEAMIGTGTPSNPNNTINNNIVYIESPTYDTRLVNGAILPQGGFTIVSPYDVYIKAQEKDVDNDGTDEHVFNYEQTEKTSASDGPDQYFQPTAVITNSRVYFLSSEFEDFGPDHTKNYYPYPFNFPTYPYSLQENAFLQDYAWDVWNATGIPKPDSQAEATWAWVQVNLDGEQQKTLLDAGEAQWDALNSDKRINDVSSHNYFNVAVASPEEPRGYQREKWNKNIYIEGAFIKLKDKWSDKYRSYTNCEAYERNRFNLTSAYAYRARYYRVNNPYALYSYEERFWSPGGQPSGDFSAGSQSAWQLVTDFNYHQ